MARTVKIPDCSSTFEVFLNGIKYSFLGGTEVEVEDEVANLIEQHIKEHTPKEAPKTVAPFGAGGGPYVISSEDSERNNGIAERWIVNKEIYDVCINAYNSSTPFIPNITMVHKDEAGLKFLLKVTQMGNTPNDSFPHIRLQGMMTTSAVNHFVFPDTETLSAYWSYEMV